MTALRVRRCLVLPRAPPDPVGGAALSGCEDARKPVNYDCYTTAMVAKPAHAVHSRPPQHAREVQAQEFHYTFITMHRTLLALPGREPLVNRLAC